MGYKEALGLLSVALSCIGYSRYFWHIFKKQTKPHAFSWIVWGLTAAIAFFAQRSDAAGAGAWITGFSALTFFAIAAWAVFRGERDIRRSDWWTFTGALAAIPLWYFTGNPLGAVILVTAIDTLGYYPTFRKAYCKPHEETALTHGLDVLKFIPALFAMDNFTVITLLYPSLQLAADGALTLMIMWRRTALKLAKG